VKQVLDKRRLVLTIATVINGICAIPVGMLVDRFGPRSVGLVGVLLTTFTFGLMGTSTGQSGQWFFCGC
jgi:nitrate/nitrite transporter NarK